MDAAQRQLQPDDLARNLLDYAVASQEITQAFGYSAAYANAPRTFGATARVSF